MSRFVAAMMRTSTRRSRLPPTRRTDAVLERAQQPRLQIQRQLADLVQEQRAALGALEGAGVLGVRAREGAPLVPEQLALDQVGRDRAAIEDDERPAGARAGFVDRVRKDVLARAGLAAQGQRHLAGRQPAKKREHLVHRGGHRHRRSEGLRPVRRARRWTKAAAREMAVGALARRCPRGVRLGASALTADELSINFSFGSG